MEVNSEATRAQMPEKPQSRLQLTPMHMANRPAYQEIETPGQAQCGIRNQIYPVPSKLLTLPEPWFP